MVDVLEKTTADVIPFRDLEESDEPGKSAHIVKTTPGETATAAVLRARVEGSHVEALCGYKWVPSKDPKQLPICSKCKEIYEMYKMNNDRLRDTPDA